MDEPFVMSNFTQWKFNFSYLFALYSERFRIKHGIRGASKGNMAFWGKHLKTQIDT